MKIRYTTLEEEATVRRHNIAEKIQKSVMRNAKWLQRIYVLKRTPFEHTERKEGPGRDTKEKWMLEETGGNEHI